MDYQSGGRGCYNCEFFARDACILRRCLSPENKGLRIINYRLVTAPRRELPLGQGHVSRDCTGAPKEKSCYRCGGVGHISRECPQAGDSYTGGAPGGQECYKCGQSLSSELTETVIGGEVGHVSRDCPTEAKGERVCYKCKQPGHVQAACPN
ncbi:hypothetical protein ASPZODRAFT_145306 [Penicilliopsis zonata CBS 506.65]|uniref:CCHC-type domain-containing protein n=1 Tax=Penicilliopsis zonata CBS 506.65 TaxID=1073090 RepID=A0A1L9SAH7_9EURO|nr:hypothetical protein ASPZODRAFT_145306 [Penicilliopsis zonata CBS 506.65]OJJ44195.1 hypothetical protein ASPZODRAFT_145306 [Penicilliopsis zonata CBS 506.65]